MAQNLIGGLLDLAGSRLDMKDKQEFAREMMIREQEYADLRAEQDFQNRKKLMQEEFNLLKEELSYREGLLSEEAMKNLDVITATDVAQKESGRETGGFLNPLYDADLTKEWTTWVKYNAPNIETVKKLPDSKDGTMHPQKQAMLSYLLDVHARMNQKSFIGDDLFSSKDADGYDAKDKQTLDQVRALILSLDPSADKAVSKNYMGELYQKEKKASPVEEMIDGNNRFGMIDYLGY